MVVVDDTPAVRLVLRTVLSLDERFEVVGEAVDGIEAVTLARDLQPDLMVLDRDMPRLDGVRAIPRVRAVAPRCAIVLFTASADALTYQAAISAGARDVLDKSELGPDLVDALGAALLEHLSELGAMLEVRVGPVPVPAARSWIANTRRLLEALRQHPEALAEPVAPDVLDVFERFLEAWESVAGVEDDFFWQARAVPADVRVLFEQWAAIDRMSDEQLASLGCSWAPPEAAPFFHALTSGVLEALQAHEATQDLAEVLGRQWAEPVERQPPTSPT